MPSFPALERFSDRNFTGICHFDVIDVQDVTTVPQEVAGNVASSIGLVAGASWKRVYLDDAGGYLRDQWLMRGGDQYSSAEAGGAIPRDRLELMPHLWLLKGRRYLVVATTKNGDKLLMGTKTEPVMIRVLGRETGDAENLQSERNEYRILMTLQRRTPVPFYGGTVPEPEPGGGGGDCPTFDEQLAELSDVDLLASLDANERLDGLAGSFWTTDGGNLIATVLPGEAVNAPQSVIRYKNTANATVETTPGETQLSGANITPETIVPRGTMRNSEGTGYNFVTLSDLIAGSVPNAPNATYQRKDSAGADIGTAVNVAAGNSVNVTCPDGTVTVRNLNGDTLGSSPVRSNGTANYTAPIPLKFVYALGEDTSTTWTVTADEAGTYGTYTNDGSSGTITYSKNGGAFTALSGSISLAVGDTIAVRRTTFNAAGWVRWAP